MMFIKKKRMMETFPQRWRNLWAEWQLRGLILLSLSTQIILIILGNRRKYKAGTLIKVIVWSAYLLADTIATMSIGIISKDLGDVHNHYGIVDAKYELTTFWAPLLLLHLGGTDTITAYSLEDNELWKRHLLGVVVQATAILYIFWLASGTSSHVLLLFILMFFVGLVKYCERVWVLYRASENKFRDSIPDIPTNYSKVMYECILKQEEGYHLTTHQVLEVDLPEHLSNESWDQYNIPDSYELLIAYSLLEMVKRLFADPILGFQDRDASKEIFENLSPGMAFKVIEIEFGFIYDIFYTKAKSIYSPLGIAVRIIGIFVTLIVLLLFLTLGLGEKHRHSKIDVNITLVLLGVALLLDLCAFRELLLSDQTARWLIKHEKTTCLKVISALRLNCNKKRRWSSSVCQFSLLRFSLRNKPLPHYGILKMFRIEKVLEIQPYDILKSYVDDIKYLIFMEIKKVNSHGTDLFGRRGGRTLEEFGLPDLAWSVRLGFDQSILIWHLATEICYFQGYINPNEIKAPANKVTGEREPKDERSAVGLLRQRCKYLSRYMLYLLVRRPNMLPIGMGNIKFHSIYAGIGDFIEKQRDKSVEAITLEHASKTLSTVASEFTIAVAERDISNFVMFHASKLASDLDECQEKWEIIKNVWLEMLCHAAGQCKGRLHAQQLRRGGELLTHAWLLMAHFGLTDHFQIPSSPPIAEAILR